MHRKTPTDGSLLYPNFILGENYVIIREKYSEVLKYLK
jgi:hypothetical protein